MCFELTQHGDSIAGIIPGLSAALQKDVGLLHACLPSMALLAQLSPQHAADDVMDHILSLCSRLESLPPSLRGSWAFNSANHNFPVKGHASIATVALQQVPLMPPEDTAGSFRQYRYRYAYGRTFNLRYRNR